MTNIRPILAAGVLAAAVSLGAMAGTAKADSFQPAGAAVKVATVTSGSGYTNTEGPIYDGNGDVLFCELNSNHANDLIWSYNIASGNVNQVVSNSGGTEGDFFNPGGQLVTADRDTRQVSLRSASNISTVQTVLASSFGGKQFNGPNDLVVDSQGGVFFTDPNFENFSNRQPQDAVCYITPGGTVNQVLPFGTQKPNGVIISPDQSTLYVGLWGSNVIDEYSLNTPGNPTNERQFVTATEPDGLTVDPWGDLIAAREGGVSCWSPNGTKLFDVSIPEANFDATNVELVGDSLYVTAGISLYRIPLTEISTVPEASTLGMLGMGAVMLLRRRRRSTSPR